MSAFHPKQTLGYCARCTATSQKMHRSPDGNFSLSTAFPQPAALARSHRELMSAFDPLRTLAVSGRLPRMGKRSGVPHRDDELERLSLEELQAELERSRVRLSIAGSAKMAKQWHKRIHWLESALAGRD